jgi:UDP-2,3-diacylglucosamine hydrolase
MRALFISDVHAGPAMPACTQALITLLTDTAPRLTHLFLLGDIFDAWLGDDDLRAPHDAVISALRRLTDGGVKTAFVHGNHDFLVGNEFTRQSGVTVLPEISDITLGTQTVTLCHGDELCTDDVEYQAFRGYARDADNQQRFLSQTLAERAEEAMRLRAASQHAMQVKAEDIMDVNEDAVRSLLSSRRTDILIHGHTHRPADHVVDIDGRTATRRVLGDWSGQGEVLLWNNEELLRLNSNDVDAHL